MGLKLLEPITIGELNLKNRIIMAPLTRARAGGERIPNELMSQYYVQRASAGLIISEATSVHPLGVGYANTPGIWSQQQVDGWSRITEAVHRAGSRMFLQLWHVGRISDPIFLNGQTPVAPSAIAARGEVSLLRPKRAYPVPRALSLEEINQTIEYFSKAAKNARLAGFDGVEIHAANGYLIDQFLQDGSNKRDDIYGGSIENRARFLLEIVDNCIEIWGAGRVGVHLAPRRDSHDMFDSNPLATFSFVAKELDRRKIAFIFSREYEGLDSLGPHIRNLFRGTYIMNERFTLESAEAALCEGRADAIAFGRSFIANPDLPQRFKLHEGLNAPRPESFYTSGAEGYTDYPAL